jgi:hypothetical protein
MMKHTAIVPSPLVGEVDARSAAGEGASSQKALSGLARKKGFLLRDPLTPPLPHKGGGRRCLEIGGVARGHAITGSLVEV